MIRVLTSTQPPNTICTLRMHTSFPGLLSKPFHDAHSGAFSWVQALEASHGDIKRCVGDGGTNHDLQRS
jgi:hypothetical protein